MNNEQLLKQVREAIDSNNEITKELEEEHCGIANHWEKESYEKAINHNKTIDLALRFMEKMLGEPGEGMVDKGDIAQGSFACECSEEVFKAMVQQALKELEE